MDAAAIRVPRRSRKGTRAAFTVSGTISGGSAACCNSGTSGSWGATCISQMKEQVQGHGGFVCGMPSPIRKCETRHWTGSWMSSSTQEILDDRTDYQIV